MLCGLRYLVKTGGRLIKHARYYWLLLAESHLTRRVFTGTLKKDCDAAGADGIALGGGSQIDRELMVG